MLFKNLSICFAVGVATLAVAQEKINPEEAAIRAIPTAMADGWNTGSGAKFAAHFAENADYVVVNGMHIQGRKEIDKGHQGLFDGIYKGSTNKATVESLRFIRPDVVLMRVQWDMKAPVVNFAGKARYTMIVVKTNGSWQIESFHNTPIQVPKEI